MNTSSNFKSPWWLPGGHLQTIWPSIVKRKCTIELKRERLILPDGDFLDLDWAAGNETSPLVILMHGLEGSIDSNYAKGMLSALNRAGLQPLLMHFRGCSGEHNIAVRSYHAGETSDFKHLVQVLKNRFPSRPIAAVGFSLGANVILKYLGESETDTPICCAVAISAPFLLNRFADRIQKGFSSLYQRRLLSQLKKKLLNKNKQTKLPIDVNKIENNKTFWEFDNLITAKLHNFKDAADYYKQSSSFYYLPRIKKPTLLLHASNDPFLYPDAIPDPSKLPPQVQLELQKSGGHMGFMTGPIPWKPKYWLEDRAPRFITAHLPYFPIE
ncbi:MAG: hydrolase [Verrucomicrobia bacterium]|nr:hydrolase [Verrucomicrobiota bacterium]